MASSFIACFNVFGHDSTKANKYRNKIDFVKFKIDLKERVVLKVCKFIINDSGAHIYKPKIIDNDYVSVDYAFCISEYMKVKIYSTYY